MSTKDLIKIAGKPYQIMCSQPYTLGKNQPYKINKFIDGKKSRKITEQFSTKEEADEFYDKNNDKWFIDYTDAEGSLIGETERFSTKEEADETYRLNIYNNRSILQTAEDEEDEEIIKELESSFRTLSPISSEEDEDEDEDEEKKLRKAEVKEAEKVYEESTQFAMSAAKNLLSSVASLFLEEKLLNSIPYIKQRLYYEEQSISNITLQIIIANKVLKKFYKEIIKNPTAKNIETLGKVQKTILDISRYQREYLGEIEKSFKQLQEDYTLNKFVNTKAEEAEAEEITENNGIIATNSRQKLIEEIRSINSESKIRKIPMSPNKSLQQKGDQFEDKPIINVADDNETFEGEIIGNTGLECSMDI